MLRNIVLWFICLLMIGGCKGSSIDAASYVENTVTGLELPPSYGIVTGVRYITIQNDTGYNTAGTITGGTPGGLFGHVMQGERQVVIGVAVAGVLAGQAMQRWLARSQFVELFIRLTDWFSGAKRRRLQVIFAAYPRLRLAPYRGYRSWCSDNTCPVNR